MASTRIGSIPRNTPTRTGKLVPCPTCGQPTDPAALATVERERVRHGYLQEQTMNAVLAMLEDGPKPPGIISRTISAQGYGSKRWVDFCRAKLVAQGKITPAYKVLGKPRAWLQALTSQVSV